MKIVMAASEANPLVKTGGLADVTYALSHELVKKGHEVFIFLPFYKSIKEKNIDVKYEGYDYVDLSWRHQYIGVYYYLYNGIHYFLLDNEYYFNRDGLYGYSDDGERFAFFSLAVQKIINRNNINPDVVHVHDWQVGMLPALMKLNPLNNNKQPRYILTIHNPAFKGYLPRESLGDLYNLPISLYDNGEVRLEWQVSTLKAGIYYADKITTVSPTHRNELLTTNLSQGLSYVLEFRKHDFVGILNGIDVDEFNPETDKYLIKNYNQKAFSSGKKACKTQLLQIFNLPNLDAPTYSIVSRLTWQKGIDLVLQNAEHLINNGANLIILGSGERELELAFEQLHQKYPNNVGIYIGYNNELAHKIYAGSDFFLMPSLFEPCGIGQIIAQRYGTLPIVRETGGLYDTVHPEIDGFTFYSYSGFSLGCVISISLEYYKDKKKMNQLIKNALNLDRSWSESANKYLDLYN